MNRRKQLNLGLILSSLIVYLEWGGNNSSFLFQSEIDVISQLTNDPLSSLHPFILLPILGQILLVITLFQKNPSRLLSYIGLFGCGILIVFIFFVGLISFEWKTLISTIPYLVTSYLVISYNRKTKNHV